MARRKILAGSTSVVVPIFIQDSSSTTGAGLGSLVYNSSGLAAKYRRQGDSSWTTISLVTATAGTFTSSGFVSDGGPVTGGYELGIPNAALATGATWVQIAVYGATNMLAVLLEIELDAVNYQDATRFGLSALPNANAGASGGLPLSVDTSGRVDVLKINGTSQTARDIGASVLLSPGTGTGQLDFTSGVVKANATQILGGTIPTPNTTGVPLVDTKYVGGTTQTARDIGASVLLSAGTGTGQLDITSGVVKANATQFSGQTITAAAGVTIPSTIASPTNITGGTITTATNLTNLPSIPTGWLTASGIAAGALNGKGDWSTYAGGDTSGTTTLLSRLTSTRATLLDNLDAAITTRMATFSYTTPPTAAAIVTAIMTDLLSGTDFNTVGSFGKLVKDYLDAAVSTRLATSGYTAPDNTTIGTISTNIGANGAGLTAIGDTRLGNLDAAVSTRLATSGYTAPDNASASSAASSAATAATQATNAASQTTAANIRTAVGLAAANLDSQLGAIPTTFRLKKNTAFSGFSLVMFNTAGAAATGKTVSGSVSIDGGAFGALTNSVSEIGSGAYKVNLDAADTNGNDLLFLFTATDCKPLFLKVITQP